MLLIYISVLSRAKNFIPMLVNANHQLQKDMKETSAEKFDIENVDQDEKFIEMVIVTYFLLTGNVLLSLE